MALLRRIKHSNLKTFANQFQRTYFQVHSPCRVSNSNSFTKLLVLNYPSSHVRKCRFEFPSSVRFFAAPVQAKPKREEDTGPRLNEKITADVVRLVTDDGHHVMPKHEALKRARNLKLDLVEVQRNSKPPVCKIMDYHREKYQQEQKEKDRLKKKSEGTLRKGSCKEIRFSGNITQKDLQIKVDMSQTEQASFYSPSSPRPNYGMFNQVDNAPGKQSVPAETNRYRRRNPPDAVEHTGRRVRASPSPRF
ncbi:hypothetical protein M9H77_33798 [Catharanthus roseus]|uniref:Uncharacterized protein n=1 Tax=Catharanthus roseus TaxID=4058 RepID=A0ACB9ZJR6_CATRO|nr:hypothetical protein M9H77_33798 [Catharanthus roseus]